MIHVVKIGGNVVENPDMLRAFVKDFASMPGKKVLVHGGGVMASRLQKDLGMTTVMIEGRRVTDAQTLQVVTMAYAGWCSKHIVALLQAEGCNAAGLSGADGNAICARKRPPIKVAAAALPGNEASPGPDEFRMVDYGYVGDVDASGVNAGFLHMLIEAGAINHDGNGNLLNTNADTIASSVAMALAGHGTADASGHDEVELTFCFEKDGVLYDRDDDSSIIPEMDNEMFSRLRAEGKIADGMIPKLSGAFKAISSGASRVTIKHARNLLRDIGTVLTGHAKTSTDELH